MTMETDYVVPLVPSTMGNIRV